MRTVEEARAHLQEVIPRGTDVYTVVRHVSKSGMTRDITVLVVDRDSGRIHDWSVAAARVLGWRHTDRGVRVGGAGMDMGFHLVYSLSRALHDDGYALNHRTL